MNNSGIKIMTLVSNSIAPITNALSVPKSTLNFSHIRSERNAGMLAGIENNTARNEVCINDKAMNPIKVVRMTVAKYRIVDFLFIYFYESNG